MYVQTFFLSQIGNNPISMEGCLKLLKSVSGDNSSVMHVGMEVRDSARESHVGGKGHRKGKSCWR